MEQEIDRGTNNWREQAEALFFVDHLRITEIEKIVQVGRKYITAHLRECEEYQKEKEFRNLQSKAKRKEYQRSWDKINRSTTKDIEKEMLKRQHIEAVNILSHEKY